MLPKYYPLLSGIAFLLPQCICGVYMGVITDKVNRVRLLGIACILWSSTTLVDFVVDDFYIFTAMRVMLGIFSAAAIPPALSLIRDYFPPNYRSQANSIFAFSDFLGAGISSLSLIFIAEYGWREDYGLTGLVGVLSGILCLTVLQEPERG